MKKLFNDSKHWGNLGRLAILALVATVILVAWRLTYKIDSPIDAVTWSNTFAADPGWHSKWAQNLVRYGQPVFEYDFNFLPASPFNNLVQAGVFWLMGSSFEVQRLYGLVLLAALLGVFYCLVRCRLAPIYAWAATAMLAVNVNIVSYTRAAYVEPLGMVLAMASSILYIRARDGGWRIAGSIGLAFLAVFTKAHFAAVLVSVIFLWAIELLVRLRTEGWASCRRDILWVVGTTALSSGALLVFIQIYQAEYEAFSISVGSRILGDFTRYGILRTLYYNELKMLRDVVDNTDAIIGLVGLGVIFVLTGFRIMRRAWWNDRPIVPVSRMFADHRSEALMFIWLTMTLFVIGISSYQPPRYFLPAIIPLTFFLLLGVDLVQNAVAESGAKPSLTRVTVPVLIVVAMLAYLRAQVPSYANWFGRSDLTSQYDALDRIGRMIATRTVERPVWVIGNQSSMLSLVHPLVRALETSFVPTSQTICDRLNRWRPQFATGTGDEVSAMQRTAADCGVVLEFEVLEMVYSYDARDNVLVLYRIIYFNKLE